MAISENFKVGDRVRFISPGYTLTNKTGTITRVFDNRGERYLTVAFDGGDISEWYARRFKKVKDNSPEKIAREVVEEYRRARAKHKPYPTAHHGLAVIEEELAELREHVYHDTYTSEDAHKEALQIAATALAFVLEVCDVSTP